MLDILQLRGLAVRRGWLSRILDVNRRWPALTNASPSAAISQTHFDGTIVLEGNIGSARSPAFAKDLSCSLFGE
jgi:hypothetical protein